MDLLVAILLVCLLSFTGFAFRIQAGQSLVVGLATAGAAIILLASQPVSLSFRGSIVALLLAGGIIGLHRVVRENQWRRAGLEILVSAFLLVFYVISTSAALTGVSETLIVFGSDHAGYVQGASHVVHEVQGTAPKSGSLESMKTMHQSDSRALSYAVFSIASLLPSGLAFGYQVMAALVFSSLGSQLALASKSLFRSLLILLAFLASQILDVMVMGYFAKGLFFSLALVVLSVVGRGTSSPVSSLVIGAILTGAYGFGAAALLAIIVFCAALLTETVVWSLKLQADRRARRTVRQLFGRSRSALFVMLGTFLSAGFLMNLQGLDARAGSGPFTRNQLLTNFLDLTWWGRVEEINSIHAGSVSLILTACVLGLFVSLTRGEPTVAFQLTFLLGFSGLVFFSPLGTWVSYHFVSLGALVVLLALATTRLRTGLFALGLAALVIAGFSAARLSNGSPSAEIRTAEANEDRRVSAPKVDLSDCSKPLIEIGSSVSTPVALYLQNVIEDLEPERSVVSREVYQSERAWKEWPARFGPSSSTQGLEWSGGSFRCQAR